MAAVAFAAQAVDVTVFDGTATSSEIPISSRFMDWSPFTHQVIYPAAELTALQGKDIKSVKYYIYNTGGCTLKDGKVSLSIGITDQADFAAYSPSYVTGLTLVAEMPMQVGVNEIEFVFDTAWKYEGGNIVIQTVIEADGSVTGSEGTFFLGQAVAKQSANGSLVNVYDFAPKTTFTYDGEEPQVNIATTLAQANAMDDNAEFTFNGDAVVTLYKEGFQGVNYMFLRDESGFSMIAGVEDTFENGQVLSQGWNATKTSVNNGWVRYTDATGLSASGEINAELAAPIELSTVPDESLLNAYVVIKKTSVSNASGGFPGLPSRVYTLPDGNTIGKSETLWAINGDASGGDFNVYGVIIKVGNALKINPVAFEPYEEPQPEWQLGDVNHDTFVNVADVTAMIQYILTSGAQPEEFYVEQANVDGEGQINVADVTALIQIILAN